MDVKSSFLNGYINKEVYVEQPKGFTDPNSPDHIFKLNKAHYDLKQAPRAWYERLTEFLINNGYNKRGIEKTPFLKNDTWKLMTTKIYVDDIVFGGMYDMMVQHFIQQMQYEFETSLVGELTYSLSLQVKQMEDNIFVSQSKYAKIIVKKFGLDNASHKRTPTVTHLKLSRDENVVDVGQSLYISMIVSLIYLIAIKHDITFFVGVCARYLANPKAIHLTQVKIILKYRNGTIDYGILYSHDTYPILIGYCDIDWGVSADEVAFSTTRSRCKMLL